MEGPAGLTAEEAGRYLTFMKFPSVLTLDEYAALLKANACAARVARFYSDRGVHLPAQTALARPGSIPLAIIGGELPAWRWDLLDAIETAGGRIALNATEPGERSLLPGPRHAWRLRKRPAFPAS
jgi:hypothetical protein